MVDQGSFSKLAQHGEDENDADRSHSRHTVLGPVASADLLHSAIYLHFSTQGSEEFAGEAHQSRGTAPTALTLHVHLKRHFPSRIDRALLVCSPLNIAHPALLIEQFRRFRHCHSDHLGLPTTAAAATAAREHLECLHGSAGAQTIGIVLLTTTVLLVELLMALL